MDRRVNLGHVLTTLVLIVGGLMAHTELSTRVAVLENDGQRMEREITQRLDRMERKLDEVISGHLNRSHGPG